VGTLSEFGKEAMGSKGVWKWITHREVVGSMIQVVSKGMENNMKAATKLFQKILIREMSTTKCHILHVGHPVENVVSKAAVSTLERFTRGCWISLEHRMASMDGHVIEGLAATFMKLNNPGVGRFRAKTSVFALETDGKKAIRVMGESLTNPRGKIGKPCTKRVIIPKCL
jgi:hypothetical protein